MPNETPTWDDTIDAPSWSDTSPIDEQFKRDELAKQVFEARIEGERAKLGTALATAGGNAAYWVADALAKVDPTGVSANILARQGVQRTPPILTPEDIDTATEVVKKGLHIPETAPAEGRLGEVTRGLSEAGKEMAVGFSDPGMIAGLGLAKALPQQGARLFQYQMLGALPSTVEQAMQAQNLEEAVKGGAGVLANVAFPIQLAGAAAGPKITVPDFIGRQLEIQRGAIPPRGEPIAPIERVTPEQAAVAADRMSKESTSAIDPKTRTAMEAVDDFYRNNPKGQDLLANHLQYGDDIKKIMDDEGYLIISNALSQSPKDPVSYFEYREKNYGYPREFTAAVLRLSKAVDKFQPSEETRAKIDAWIDRELGTKTRSEYLSELENKLSKQKLESDVPKFEETKAVEPTVAPEKTEVAAPEAPSTFKLSNKSVGTIWNKLIKTARDDVDELLVNWQNAELNADATKIIGTIGRDRNDKVVLSKKEFINWLHSDDPFNPKSFVQDPEWVDLVNRIRAKTGLETKPSATEPTLTDQAVAKPSESAVEQHAQPIPQGPGAQTLPKLTVETPESYSGTALKNAVAEVERAGWGMREAPEHIRKQVLEGWIRAGRTLELDPLAGEKLVDELVADPSRRGLSFDESGLLLRQKVTLTNKMNDAAERIHTAKTDKAKEQAEADYGLAHEQMLTMLDAIKNRGTAWGQEGRWRQVMAREDFSLATLITQREAALGRKIKPGTPEFEELKKHANRLQELNKQLEDRVAKVQADFEASEVKRAIAEAQANANKELPYHPRILELAEGYAKKWDERGNKALENIKAMFGEGQAFSGAPVSPALLDNAIIYGTSKMIRGAVDVAKWTDAMVRDLGEGFRKHAAYVFEKSKEAFDKDVSNEFKKQGAATTQRVKGALKGAELGTVDILKKIANKASKVPEGKLPNINYYLRKLGRIYAREGIKEEGPFLDRMTADVQKVLPNLTRDDVRAIFGGYAEEVRALSKEPVEVILRDMRGQSRELHKLSLLKQKIIPPKLQERAIPSQKERLIRKQVEAEKRTGGFAPPDPEVQLRSAMQSAETRLTNQINDLQREIDTKQKIAPQKREPLHSEKLDALRAHRDALREIHDDVFRKPDLTDAERLEIWKERVKEQIDELRDRRRRGDFKPKPKPDPLRYDKEAIELQYQKEVEHRALQEMRLRDELAKRTTPEVIKDSLKNTATFAHMAMAGGEFSAVFKQGATGAYSMPIRTARNFAKSLQAWMSEENQFKIKHEILTRDNAPFYRRDKLEFTDVGGRLSSMEEMYMFRVMDWMKRVPILRSYIRYMDRFQRAFSTFLNLMRADTYDAMVREMGSTPEAGAAAANYINVATGRGSHSTARFGGQGMNAFFFAPRWSISRFQYLFGQPILAAKPGFRKYVVKQYAKTMIGLGSVYALGYAMGGTVDWNPTSSKFGKIQIGNRVIDPLFGLVPVIRLMSQIVTGLRKNNRGKIRPIREGGKLPVFEEQIQGSRKLAPFEPSGAELIGKFAWSKLAPAPETFVSGAGAENVIGEKFSIPKKVVSLITPITYVDILRAIKEEGIDEKTAIDLMAIFGLSSYIEKPKTNSSKF